MSAFLSFPTLPYLQTAGSRVRFVPTHFTHLSNILLFLLGIFCFLPLLVMIVSKWVIIMSPVFNRNPSCFWNDSSILIWYRHASSSDSIVTSPAMITHICILDSDLTDYCQLRILILNSRLRKFINQIQKYIKLRSPLNVIVPIFLFSFKILSRAGSSEDILLANKLNTLSFSLSLRHKFLRRSFLAFSASRVFFFLFLNSVMTRIATRVLDQASILSIFSISSN